MINFLDVVDKNVEGLNDDQKKNLDKLFQNAISERVAEIHRDYDRDIAEATGQRKPAGVKTYEWMKAEFSNMKKAAEKAAQDATAASADKISRLEGLLEKAKKEGSGGAQVAELQQQLQDAKNLAEDLRNKHAGELKEWESKYNTLNQDYRKADTKQHLSGFEFRKDIPEDLREMAISNAVNHVLSLTSETDDNGNVIYRDESGKIMTNPENNLAPFTTSELLAGQLASVLDKGHKQNGTGTKPGQGGGGSGGSFVLNATTQEQAMQQITQHLYDKGIPQGHPDHQKTIDKVWEESKIADLPPV